MKIFDKLKTILRNKKQQVKASQTLSKDESTHLYPITVRLMAWLDKQGWHYEHKKPHADHEARTHHVILSFADNDWDWTCVFRINEQSQLLSIFGILPNTVPASHYAPMLMKIAHTNLNIIFGSIELDPNDGEVRIKMTIDAEFSTLSDKALGCYLQGVAGLTEHAQRLFDEIMDESEPSPLVHDYLDVFDDNTPADDGFFMPTQQSQ